MLFGPLVAEETCFKQVVCLLIQEIHLKVSFGEWLNDIHSLITSLLAFYCHWASTTQV